ncbi:MAG: hypothetical protein WC435_01235 [Candidatus Paceibacterota bacterium]
MNVSVASVFVCPNCFDWDQVLEKVQAEIKNIFDFFKNEEIKKGISLN